MTNDPAPVVRDATPEDLRGMLEVLNAAYGHWPSIDLTVPAIDHLRWKMSPGDGLAPKHTVILIDDRVVVTRLRWQNHIRIGNRDYVNETGADLAVHPDFRGRGLARLMVDSWVPEFLANPKPSLGMKSGAPEVLKMDFPDEITRSVTTWHRPFGLRQYLAVHRRGGIRQLARAMRAWAWSRRAPALDGGRLVEVLQEFDQRIDALWKAVRASFDVIPFRTAAYLNWRFARPASGEPRALALTDGDRILAYAVVKRAGPNGELQDFLSAPDHPEAVPLIIEAAAHSLRESGATGVTCWLPDGHPAESVLRDTGFAAVGQQTLVVGTTTQGETPPEALAVLSDESSSFHVTMSDFDWV